MHVSLNEVRTTATKAAVAAGVPVGVADEVGQAAAWLCARGEDGIGGMLEAIGPDESAAPPALRETGTGWRIAPAPIRLIGVSVADILLSEPGRTVSLGRIDAPLLLLGMLGQALARAPGEVGICVIFAERSTVRVTARALIADAPVPTAGVDASLTADEEGGGAAAHGAISGGAEVDPEAWRDLSALAARTRVPANAASRSHGAGAGDIDNE